MQVLLFFILTYYLYTLMEDKYSGIGAFFLATFFGALLAAVWPLGIFLIVYIIVTGQ